VWSVAAAALTSLGVRQLGRVDAIVDASGHAWVLEANVSPGMTDTSLLPMAAKAAGLSFEEMCDRIILSTSR
jgi:D-alanine-D-alanine ligase